MSTEQTEPVLGSKERPARILVLNYTCQKAPLLFLQGRGAHYTFAAEPEGSSAHEFQAEAIKLARQTHEGLFDLVIIQNNEGWGLTRAKNIAQELRANNAIIIWTNERTEENVYRAMGYTHFTSMVPLEEFKANMEKFFAKHVVLQDRERPEYD